MLEVGEWEELWFDLGDLEPLTGRVEVVASERDCRREDPRFRDCGGGGGEFAVGGDGAALGGGSGGAGADDDCSAARMAA